MLCSFDLNRFGGLKKVYKTIRVVDSKSRYCRYPSSEDHLGYCMFLDLDPCPSYSRDQQDKRKHPFSKQYMKGYHNKGDIAGMKTYLPVISDDS